MTGGEPMLQVDTEIVAALHAHQFTVAIESNGTILAHPDIDWVCISPKAGSVVVQHSGDELKLVWPQSGSDMDAIEHWQFDHFLIQPMDSGDNATNAANVAAATRTVMGRPKWRLSLQNHKILGLP
jgi:organic radical activating enzyme